MSSTSTPPPQTLGRYRIVRRLGAGGMAEVFLARSSGAEGIDKLLVVKRVLPTFVRNAKFRTMFIDEAKVAMRLNHPNIVQVYTFEQVREEFFLAMEYVDGLDLGRLVGAVRRAKRRLPYSIAAYIVAEAAKGLDYAHNRKDEQGEPLEIVHRDVSPQNVLLSFEGSVKIADFGIARARMISEDTGIIKGKFAYMSPEQAQGKAVDRRSDVYSLGVLLAELLMGRSMYAGQGGLDVLDLVRQGKLTLPRKVDFDVPIELEQIVQRATEIDVEARFQSARSLSGALAQWLHAQDDVVDGAAVEALIGEVAPRDSTSPDAAALKKSPGEKTDATVATLAALARERGAERDQKERRHVVVVAGLVHAEQDGHASTPDAVVDPATAHMLEEIAYKADAVLRWSGGDADKRRFRLVLGLGRVTAYEPLRGTRLALDVLDALSGLSADSLSPIRAALGISRGVVTTTRSSDGRLRSFEPVGSVLDIADKLAQAAAPNEVLAGGEIFRGARREFAFDDREPREVTFVGLGESVPKTIRAYRLLRAFTRDERMKEASLEAGALAIIGRERELRAITEAYQESVQTPRSGFLAITGELGVGKSALLSAALASFDPPPRILRTDCAFGSGEVPYAAVAELIAAACGIRVESSPEDVRKDLDASLRELIPSASARAPVYTALELLIAPRTGVRAADEGGEDHIQANYRALRTLFGAIAMRGPLVVCIDSLHWADGPSLEILAAFLKRVHDVPHFTLLSTRPDPRITAALGNIPELALSELDGESGAALVRARFGGALVPQDVERAILDRAGGNPFFIGELVEALVERGIVNFEGEGTLRRVVRKPGHFALPRTLEAAVAARITELPSEERRLLRWLAAVGPGMRSVDLSDLLGTDATESLRSLGARGLIERKPNGTYAFHSAVARHIAYETSDPDDRQNMHKRIGAYLSALDQPVAPARIARHLELAGEHAEAARAYFDAAKAAHAADSNRYALRLYQKALLLLGPDDPTRFRAYTGKEQILRAMGQRHERRVELEAMRALSERLNDASFKAQTYNLLARYELEESRTAGVEALLRRATDSAIEANDRGAEVEALRLMAQLARELGDVPKSLDACERALIRAGTDESSLEARGLVLVQRAILLRRIGRLEDSLSSAAESIVIFRRIGHKRNESNALNALAVALAGEGAFEDAVVLLRSSVALDRETGNRFHLGMKLSNIGQLYADLGDTSHAISFLHRALEVFDELDDKSGLADALSALAEVLIEQAGDSESAVLTLDRARFVAETTQDHYDLAPERIVRAAIESWRGRHDDALSCLQEAVSESRAAGMIGYELLALGRCAELLATMNRDEEAREIAIEVLVRVRTTVRMERLESIYLALHRVFERVGDSQNAMHTLEQAQKLVEGHLVQIRDSNLRSRYLESRTVQNILGSPS